MHEGDEERVGYVRSILDLYRWDHRAEDLEIGALPVLYRIPDHRWTAIKAALENEDLGGQASLRGFGHLEIADRMSRFEIDPEGVRMFWIEDGNIELFIPALGAKDMKGYDAVSIVPSKTGAARFDWGERSWGYSLTVDIPITCATEGFLDEVLHGRHDAYSLKIDRSGAIRSVHAANEEIGKFIQMSSDAGEKMVMNPLLDFIEFALEKMRVTAIARSGDGGRTR